MYRHGAVFGFHENDPKATTPTGDLVTILNLPRDYAAELIASRPDLGISVINTQGDLEEVRAGELYLV